MTSTRKAESLFQDMLDDEFIQVFQPIHIVQRCLGFQRVYVKYNFVTEASAMAQFYAGAITFVNIISIVDVVLNCETGLNTKFTDESLKLCLILTACLTNVVIWRNNFPKGNLNSSLYVKLQRLDRILNMSARKAYNRKLVSLALTLATISVFLAILWILVLNLITLKHFCPSTFFAILPASGNFTEMILCVHIMLFLMKRVDFVNNSLQVLLKKKNKRLCKNSSSWATPDFQVEPSYRIDVILAMHFILDIQSDIVKLFRFQILAFIGQFILWNFVTMRIFVYSIKEQTSIDIDTIITNIPLTIAMMSLITVMSLVGGALTNKLEESRKLCISVTSYCEDNARANAKQILSLMIQDKLDVSIYDIFNLNSQLPLDLLVITANYTIVFLQFAML